MVAQRGPEHITVDEWRDMERASHDIKHEYIDGQAYAMSGGSLAHGRIGSNTVRTIEDVLAAANKLCSVYNSDVAVRLSSRRYTYPDTSITCDERDQPTPDKTEVQVPIVIVEVLSDSTEAYDRGRKFSLYRACPFVQEYVLVATKYQAVEVYRRTSQGWTTYQPYGSGDEIALMSIDIHFPLAKLYRNSGVPEAADESEGEV
jgi:Uma2 family endonuclease